VTRNKKQEYLRTVRHRTQLSFTHRPEVDEPEGRCGVCVCVSPGEVRRAVPVGAGRRRGQLAPPGLRGHPPRAHAGLSDGHAQQRAGGGLARVALDSLPALCGARGGQRCVCSYLTLTLTLTLTLALTLTLTLCSHLALIVRSSCQTWTLSTCEIKADVGDFSSAVLLLHVLSWGPCLTRTVIP